ncbi:MAG TPA: hypothetical protein VIJ04_07865 [Xanthobacteraceae bacterium]
MLRWFAPLLVFAARPELLARVLTLAVAAGVLAFGVWLLSHVALTFDALKNPYIEATYGVVLACFFIGVGTVTWLRVRRMGALPRSHSLLPAAELSPPLPADVVGRRADSIARKWSRGSRGASVRVAAPPITAPLPAPIPAPELAPRDAADVRWTFAVTGPPFSGKTGLIATLRQATAANARDQADVARLFDAGTVEGDANQIASLAVIVGAADGILFVVDQDLRAPELEVIGRLIGTGKPLYVVLNKADQLTAADRDTVLLSIRAKMPKQFAPAHVISVAGSPSPVEREIEDARGTVRVELRRPASDVQALINLVRREFPTAPGRALKFVAA